MIKMIPEDIKNGKKNHCCDCPVALAIKRHTNKMAFVYLWKILVGGGYFIPANDARQFKMTDQINNFIEAFDNGLPVEPIEFELIED